MRRVFVSRMTVLLGLAPTLFLLACRSGSNGEDATSSPLDALLARLPDIRQRVAESGLADSAAFLEWFDPAFLGDLGAGSR